MGSTIPWLTKRIARFSRQAFTLRFPDASAEYRIFRELQDELGVSGKHVHDIRLVAACRTLGIPAILTSDAGGFAAATQAGHIEAFTALIGDGEFEPYTATEVGRYRETTLHDPLARRREIWSGE